jgi:hypothetical protein
MNWLRHKRTVSSRTPNASERRELIQPLSVKRMLLALSASARSRLGFQQPHLFWRRPHWRLACHPQHSDSPIRANRKNLNVGLPAQPCLGRQRQCLELLASRAKTAELVD